MKASRQKDTERREEREKRRDRQTETDRQRQQRQMEAGSHRLTDSGHTWCVEVGAR